jgi:hypothetical protein
MSRPNPSSSRFNVLSEGEPARAHDGNRSYFFDGLRFWVVKPNGRQRLVVSWQTPSHGWIVEREGERPAA